METEAYRQKTRLGARPDTTEAAGLKRNLTRPSSFINEGKPRAFENSAFEAGLPGTLLDALCASFDGELERQENVLALCRAQGEAVCAHDIEAIEARTRALVVLVEDALGAEGERLPFLGEVVEYFALPVEKQTLTDLIAVSPEPWRRRMAEFQQRIQKTLEETRKVVRENAGLMRRSLRIVDSSLQLVMGTEAETAPAYEDTGGEPARTGRKPAMIDARG